MHTEKHFSAVMFLKRVVLLFVRCYKWFLIHVGPMSFICCTIFSKYFIQLILPNILYFFYFKSINPWYRFSVKSTSLEYIILSFHCFNCYTKLSKSSIEILGALKNSFSLKLGFCKVNLFFLWIVFVLKCCNLWEGTNTGATNICDTGH